MVIKTVRMGILILVSRSGFTLIRGVELARQVGLTLVGRTRGSASLRCRARSASCSTRTSITSKTIRTAQAQG